VWDARGAVSLARVAYGIPITSQRLGQVEAGETYLRELGVTGISGAPPRDLRGARIEVEPRWIPLVSAAWRRCGSTWRVWVFAAVELDPRGYTARRSARERAERA